MSTTGLEVFDKTLQTTHIWLNEITEHIGPDHQLAWHVLGAVLRGVRDQLPVELASHLGSQLPILVRGLYYDQFRPAVLPNRHRSLQEFLEGIGRDLETSRPVYLQDAARTVFQVLSRHVNRSQIDKIRQALPEDIRAIWPDDPNAPDIREPSEQRD